MVIDTSALMAVLLDEPASERCIDAMAAAPHLTISAATLTEAMIVSARHGARPALERLLTRLKPEIVPLTAAGAHLAANAYESWGKGLHPAALNFGDWFAYALATERGEPLLFVGNDFARTDVAGA